MCAAHPSTDLAAVGSWPSAIVTMATIAMISACESWASTAPSLNSRAIAKETEKARSFPSEVSVASADIEMPTGERGNRRSGSSARCADSRYEAACCHSYPLEVHVDADRRLFARLLLCNLFLSDGERMIGATASDAIDVMQRAGCSREFVGSRASQELARLQGFADRCGACGPCEHVGGRSVERGQLRRLGQLGGGFRRSKRVREDTARLVTNRNGRRVGVDNLCDASLSPLAAALYVALLVWRTVQEGVLHARVDAECVVAILEQLDASLTTWGNCPVSEDVGYDHGSECRSESRRTRRAIEAVRSLTESRPSLQMSVAAAAQAAWGDSLPAQLNSKRRGVVEAEDGFESESFARPPLLTTSLPPSCWLLAVKCQSAPLRRRFEEAADTSSTSTCSSFRSSVDSVYADSNVSAPSTIGEASSCSASPLARDRDSTAGRKACERVGREAADLIRMMDSQTFQCNESL